MYAVKKYGSLQCKCIYVWNIQHVFNTYINRDTKLFKDEL